MIRERWVFYVCVLNASFELVFFCPNVVGLEEIERH